MPLYLIHDDLTKLSCDVLVNPTDSFHSGAGGVDRQIHLAGGPEMDAACRELEELQIGAVQVTEGYGLPCRYVLHTMGPIWLGGELNEEVLLRSCYLNALMRARELHAETIAFPLISSGTFGFPKDRVLRIAQSAITEFLSVLDEELTVYLCIYDRTAFELSRAPDLRAFLEPEPPEENVFFEAAPMPMEMAREPLKIGARKKAATLEDWLKKHDDSFSLTLLKLIDRKGMTEVECYKKANISKKTFWKINNDPNYRPSKPTVLAFAIALELTLEETEQLLKTVGFSLSHSNTFDLIIEFYITSGVYNMNEINAALYQYDQVCLGC